MSDRDGDKHGPIIAFAFVVFLLIFLLIGYFEGFNQGQESRSDVYAEQHHEDAAKRIADRCAGLIGAPQTECVKEAIETAGEYQRAELDLTAQREMAKWARWMLGATVFMAFVTAFGVIFVWQTLLATQKMAADTQQIGEAQVRAYIYANVAEIDLAKNTIDVIFKNFGNSPGSVSCIDCSVTVSDPYASKNIWSQRFWSDGWTVAPQDSMREKFDLGARRASYLNRMIAQTGILVCVHGNFRSVDVFKRTHENGIYIVLSDGVIST